MIAQPEPNTVVRSVRSVLFVAFAVGLLVAQGACSGGHANKQSGGVGASGTGGGSHTGSGGLGGAGGSGAGGAAACQVATDCPGTDTDCAQRACNDGICGTAFKPDGFPTSSQVTGDCQTAECDGHGGVKMVADDTDLPNDSNPCTLDVCNKGVPGHPSAPSGTACGTGPQEMCDGQGKCVGCTKDADCGASTACTTYSCNTSTGVCSTVYTPSGQGNPGGGMSGNCKKVVCNGSGGVETVNDDTNVPAATNPCEIPSCSMGTPTMTPASKGTSCGGGSCDGQGACSSCMTDADCGTNTACATYKCTSGVCGATYVPSGQGSPSGGTKGNCMKLACDGQGGTKQVVDDSNTPDDNNPCTNDICNNGVPSHTPVAMGASCGTNLKCDGADNCVGCITNADCGTNSACATYTCQAGSCVTENTPLGMACADDGNACTSDLCNGMGVCTHPDAGLGTSCGAGKVCDAGGTCSSGCGIGGTFYAAAAANPNNSCQVCTPAKSTSAWSSQADGTACNDGNACTKSDACSAGNCAGSAYTCTPTACQSTSTCDGNGGCNVTDKPTGTACGSALICNASGTCVSGCDIGGTFYASGAKNPSNQCQTCTPNTSTTSWTNIGNGVLGCDGVCGSGKVVDSCGVCGGNNSEKGCDGVCNSGKVDGCDGVCGSGKVDDSCGVCGGNNSEKGCDGVCYSGKVVGCDGVCGSGKVVDSCGVCGGNNSEKGCDGVCNSGKVVGCDGVCGSGKVVTCGACGGCVSPQTCGGGGTPGVCGCTPNSQACYGQCGGTAPDGCGGTVACHDSCGLQGDCPCAGGHCSGNYCVCNGGPCL